MRLLSIILDDISIVTSKIKEIKIESLRVRLSLYLMILIFIILCIIFVFSNGTNSLTNWLSSISDLIMACAAIAGVIFAKNWLSQATVQEGVAISLVLKDELIPKHERIIESLTTTLGIKTIVESYLKFEGEKNIGREFFEIIQNGYSDKVSSLESSLDSLKAHEKKLLSRGWRLKEKKNETFNVMLQLSEDIKFITNDTLCFIKSINYRTNPSLQENILNLDPKSSFEIEEIKNELDENSKKFLIAYRQFKDHYSDFYEDQSFIKFYFERY